MKNEESTEKIQRSVAYFFSASSANSEELFSLFLSMTLIVRTLSNDKHLSNAE